MTVVLGTAGAHMARAHWQFQTATMPKRFRAGYRAEVHGGEVVKNAALAAGADLLVADLVPPTRDRVHGVQEPREANVDHLVVVGRRIVLVDDKSLAPGHYDLRAPELASVETTDVRQLRDQVLSGRYYDTLLAPGRMPQSITRGLHIGARELLLAARRDGVDIELDSAVLVVPKRPHTVKISPAPGADRNRPFSDAIFAYPDRTPLVTPAPLLLGEAQLAEALGRDTTLAQADSDEVEAWVTGLYEQSEARRLARIERERAAGEHLRIPNPLT